MSGGIERRLVGLVVFALLLTMPAMASAENSMVVRPNGKIVVAGGKRYGAIARYLPGGQLDRGFGGRGLIVDNRLPAFEAVAVQPDGKIVAVAGPGFQVARYLPDGKRDLDFGQNGISGFARGSIELAEEPAALVIEPDGSIVVGGTSFEKLGGSPHPTAIRINPDGRAYKALTGFGIRGMLSDLLVGPGETLIGAGEFGVGISNPRKGLLFRYLEGTNAIDSSFGQEGLATAPGDQASAVAASDDSKLLTLGSIATARFEANGALDPSFGAGGVVGPGPYYLVEQLSDIAAAPDGSVALAGSSSRDPKIFVRRLTSSGAPLASFGKSGRAVLRRPDGRKLPALAKSIAVFRSGKVLVMGVAILGKQRFVLGKFDARGKPDPGFGHHGVARVAIR